jgi:hypothetical protein
MGRRHEPCNVGTSNGPRFLMRHSGIQAVLTVAMLFGGVDGDAATRTYLAVPNVEWDEFEPYVRANIVAFLNDKKFQVVIYSGQTDRSVVGSYDESVGDFTKVLLYQMAIDDNRFHRGIGKLATEFRQRIPSLASGERANFRELFWQLLKSAPDVLPRVRRALTSAHKHGRLRCWVCEKEPTLYPAAVRWGQ